MTDIVIPLGRGSTCANEELRYSLRSIEKYALGVGKVYIIGEKPHFISDEVIHIPHKDRFQKEANIKEKILKACSIPELSEMFCFTNDDIYWLRSTDVETIPFFRKGGTDLAQNRAAFKSTYGVSIANTVWSLSENNLPLHHFDIHVPILYNKNVFPVIMSRYDWRVNNGYVIKSLYCNTLKIQGAALKDNKINTNAGSLAIKNAFRSRNVWVSSSDRCLNDFFWRTVDRMFPYKSRFEK